MASPVEVFCCYANEDLPLIKQLKAHLSPFKIHKIINISDHHTIKPGENWKETAENLIKNAQLILLCVSPDFFDSDDCSKDTQQSFEQLAAGKAHVIPIILRPCAWKTDARISNLKPVLVESNGDPLPITSWENRDAAFKNVADEIESVIKVIQLPQEPKPEQNPQLNSSYPSITPPQKESFTPTPSFTANGVMLLLATLALFIVTPGLVVYLLQPKPLPPYCEVLNLSTTHCIGTYKSSNGELIGISDGRSDFDTRPDRQDATEKQDAAQKLIDNNIGGAEITLTHAVTLIDPGDAEAHIYQENMKILAEKNPIIKAVVATTLTGNKSDVGRFNLQGAFIAQHEFNSRTCQSTCPKLYLLIANSGSPYMASSKECFGESSTVPESTLNVNVCKVARQIMEAARQDPTIIGTIGWSSSEDTNLAITTMDMTDLRKQLSLPLISPSASSDALTNKSIYFFRVVPPAQEQGDLAARYAREGLKVRRVALFSDPGDSSSKDLANAFQKRYTLVNRFSLLTDMPSIVVSEPYTSNNEKGLRAQVDNALQHKPDLIYFPGSAQDVGVVLRELQNKGQSIPVLGGDQCYQLDYDKQLGALKSELDLSLLRFTAFAYPDEWSFINKSSAFFNNYAAAFDPTSIDRGAYGKGRPNSDAILSHDALATLLEAYTRASNSSSSNNPITTEMVWQNLRNISDATAFNPQDPPPEDTKLSPASGRIAFKPYGNPSNKALVLLCFDKKQHIHLQWISKYLSQNDSTNSVNENQLPHDPTCQ